MSNKIIDALRKLGILRYGSAKGTFTSAKNKSDELTFERVYDAKKDQVHKEDVAKAAKTMRTVGKAGIAAKAIFWIAALLGAFLNLGLLSADGFTVWSLLMLALWIVLLRHLWIRVAAGRLSLFAMIGHILGVVVISLVLLAIAVSSR